MQVIAMKSNEYFPTLVSSCYMRGKTKDYVKNALATLGDYKRYGQISAEEYAKCKNEIASAPHDDAIADIMMRLRKRIYN